MELIPDAIPKELHFEEISDFVLLKRKGIEWVQQLSGDIWTDYNEHDPGVTILEQLCYALTELGVKTQLDIESLLFAGMSTQDLLQKYPLYKASSILPVGPVTATDYRRLIICDCFPIVRNAWVIPRRQSVLGLNLEGLFQVLLLPDSPGHESELIGKVNKLIHSNRNIGEDFDEVLVMTPVELALLADLSLASDAIGEAVQASIFYAVRHTSA